MNLVKVGDGKYINVDRMTYAEKGRKGEIVVQFSVGGVLFQPSCYVTLKEQEALDFIRWLDASSKEVPR